MRESNSDGLFSSERRLYKIWAGMISRCNDRKNPAFKNYGGRGISVCSKWVSFSEFVQWSRSNGYDDTLSIERIDNDGDYEPNNCAWADRKTQARNRRTSRILEYKGVSKTLAEWSEISGISYAALQARIDLHGWSIEDALTKPERKSRPRSIIEFNGRSQSIPKWAKEVGISAITLSCRINRMGWSVERALTEPVRRCA